MIDGLTTHEQGWLDTFQRRKAMWESGVGAEPLGPRFYRYELPKGAWLGGDVPPDVLLALARIDPDLEIVYDKFTTVGGKNGIGPAHHLCTRYRGVVPSHDELVLEFSLQADVMADHHKPWPQGVPVAPGMWLVPALQKYYVGNLSADHCPERRRIVESKVADIKAKKAEKIKQAFDTEADAAAEVLPYVPVEFGGMNRTLRRTEGRSMFGEPVKKQVFDVGARR